MRPQSARSAPEAHGASRYGMYCALQHGPQYKCPHLLHARTARQQYRRSTLAAVAVVQLRVPDETKERWVAQAKGRGLSLTAFVLARLDGEVPASEGRMREIAREEIESYVRRASEQRAKPKPAPVDETEDEVPPEPPARTTPPPAPARTPVPSPPSPQEPGLSDFARRSIR